MVSSSLREFLTDAGTEYSDLGPVFRGESIRLLSLYHFQPILHIQNPLKATVPPSSSRPNRPNRPLFRLFSLRYLSRKPQQPADSPKVRTSFPWTVLGAVAYQKDGLSRVQSSCISLLRARLDLVDARDGSEGVTAGALDQFSSRREHHDSAAVGTHHFPELLHCCHLGAPGTAHTVGPRRVHQPGLAVGTTDNLSRLQWGWQGLRPDCLRIRLSGLTL